MAITFVLVESTPYLLKYLCTATSASTGALGDVHGVIPNNGGVTPDLRTDTLAGASRMGVQGGAVGPYNLSRIARARIDGYGPIAAGALTVAQARALLASDDPTNAVLTNRNIMGAEISISPRTRAPGATAAALNSHHDRPYWLADVSVDASGDPVVTVDISTRMDVSSGADMTAYLTIRMRHSIDL